PASLESLFADTPEVLTLDNGLTVIFQQSLAHPLVSTQVWVKTGSMHEEQHLGSGLSHYLEHMLFKGTGKRGPGEIAREVQVFGGQINAYTSFDRTVYYIDGPSEALGQSLELLADMTLNASLPKSEVEKERDVILREIDMTLDDPDRIVSRALFSSACREHPFRYPVIGLRPLFKEVGRDVLESYYTGRYHPANMVLSVAGHFDRGALLEHIEATFAAFPRKPLRPVVVPSEPDQLAGRETRLFGSYQTARGLLAFKIPSMRHPDSPGLDILATIIGSGHSGRLRQKLREKMELVHGISASSWNPADPGLFLIQYFCEPDKAARAEEAILDTCREFAETGFTQEELDKARRFAAISEAKQRQTCSGMASRLGLVSTVVGDIHYPRRFFEKIHSLDLEQLKDLAQKTFCSDKLTTVSLLPESSRTKAHHTAGAGVLPPFQEKVLANGARLIWQEDHRIPRTWMRFTGLGGPQYEEPASRGATALLVTLLNRDTEFNDASEVARQLESNGGFMMETSGNNTFALVVETMPEGIEQGIQALHDALFHPVFREDTLLREREAQIAGLHEMEDEILDFGRLALRRHFFGEHPFAWDPCGTVETTASLNVPAMRSLWEKLIAGPNAVLVVAGDFNPDIVLPKLEELLLKIPARTFTPCALPFAGPARTGEISESMDREQAIVFEAYPDVGV
ncbi:MAG TPA: insulinase family protein, partial [Oceanipulchritudo sp.]|nr:insulinase family protein [Oceanipulchritudo sp.]